MNTIDFNSAERQQSFGLIPPKTIVPLVMNIRPGGAGDGGWYTASKTSDAMMLDVEFTVSEGPYAKRKLWQYFVMSGGKLTNNGDSVAGNISRSTLRAILESARNIKPEDTSDAAVNARRINGLEDFNGMCFLAKIGIDKDKNGQYEDKNKILAVITPDMKEYTEGYTQESPEMIAGMPNMTNMLNGLNGLNGGAGMQTPPPPPAMHAANPTPEWAR